MPGTIAPALSACRFTNVYRAADRVNRYLIRYVLYTGGEQSPVKLLFRCVLLKIFNRIEIWEYLSAEFGPLTGMR